jgi:hypothetical protein
MVPAMKKKECPACAMQIDVSSKRCPICDYEFPSTNKRLALVALLLAVFFLLYIIVF